MVASVARGRGAGPLRLVLKNGMATLFEAGHPLCAFPSVKAPAEPVWEL